MDDRMTSINIGGKDYPMMLNVYATKQIVKRYGGLEEVGNKITESSYADQLDDILWLMTVLINAGIMFNNYKENQKTPFITQEIIEAVSIPTDFMDYKDAIFTAMNKGAARHIKSEEPLGESKNVERE